MLISGVQIAENTTYTNTNTNTRSYLDKRNIIFSDTIIDIIGEVNKL